MWRWTESLSMRLWTKSTQTSTVCHNLPTSLRVTFHCVHCLGLCLKKNKTKKSSVLLISLAGLKKVTIFRFIGNANHIYFTRTDESWIPRDPTVHKTLPNIANSCVWAVKLFVKIFTDLTTWNEVINLPSFLCSPPKGIFLIFGSSNSHQQTPVKDSTVHLKQV